MSQTEHYRVTHSTVLSHRWGNLSSYEIDFKKRSGEWQAQTREVYDHGDGVACLLHDPEADTVLLVRQFRMPVALYGGHGFIIEVPAGLLDGEHPEERMKLELEEETGYRVSRLTRLFDIDTSPGSLKERVTLFIGAYRRHDRASPGGGNPNEGEDIEVLHIAVEDVLEMIASGDISDAKTVILLQHLALSRRSSPC